jgi:hypothetical protein
MTWADVWAAWRDARPDPEQEFARRFGEFIGAPRVLPAPSGRFALEALLRGFAFPPGSEVIAPALTFHSVPAVIQSLGLRPVFVDIDLATFCLAVDQLAAAITPRTVAIIPTHLYGRACAMTPIMQLARQRGLAVIEDCAQSCGGFYEGRRLGGLGDAAFFSFGPTKNLSALGAGLLATKSPEVAERADRWLRDLPSLSTSAVSKRTFVALAMRAATNRWLWSALMSPLLRLTANRPTDLIETFTAERPTGDSGAAGRRLPRPWQWRIGLRQLARLDESNERRMGHGDRLLELLRDTPGVDLPAAAPKGENIYLSFPLRVRDRATFRRRLLAEGVDSAAGYMSVCPHLPGFEASRIEAPAAARAVREMVHLPVYPELSEADLVAVAQAVQRAAGAGES